MSDLPPASEGSSASGSFDRGCLVLQILKRLFPDKLLFWILVPVLLALDYWTKHAIVLSVENTGDLLVNGASPVIWVFEPWFGLVSVRNTGGPWGMLASLPGILQGARFIAFLVILYLLAATPRHAWLQIVALAMVMGGALGNILDTLLYGWVRDFLYFDLGFPPADPWPAFNVADSLICLGVVFLGIALFIDGRRAKEREG